MSVRKKLRENTNTAITEYPGKERILITGTNGLLGQKLVSLLKNDPSFDLVATGLGPNRLDTAPSYSYLPMDITQPGEIDRVFSEVRPDIVIHTAAMTHVDQCEEDKEGCWDKNVNAVRHLTAACRTYGSFLIHLSTDFVFDGKEGPYDETGLPNPLSFYGWSKYAAEKIVADAGIRWAIARTVLVYGIAKDMSRSNLILWVKKSLEEKTPIRVVNDQWRTPTLAEDLAEGCAAIARRKAEGIFHLSGKDTLTPYQMAQHAAQHFGLDSTLISETASSAFAQKAARPPITGFVLDKAKRELDYEPRSFEQGIALLSSQLDRSYSG